MDIRKEERMISAWTLRFASLDVENAFLKGRCEGMYLNMSRCYMVCVVLYLSALVKYGYGYDNKAMIKTSLYSVLVVLFGAGAVLMRMSCVTKRLSFRTCEAVVVLTLTLLLVVLLAWAALFTVADGNQDTLLYRSALLALMLDAVITVSHIALPTRWIVVVWIDLLFVVAFAAHHIWSVLDDGSRLLGSDTSNILVFTALAIGSLVGMRSRELTERTMFTAIVDERTLRTRAEHNADSSCPPTTRRPASGPKSALASELGSARSSTPSTTDTGAMFRHAVDGQVTGEDIEALQELGRKEQWLVESDQLRTEGVPLGRGGQGEVVVGRLGRDLVAVKKPRKRKLEPADGGGEQRAIYSARMWDELRILRHVRHPNIALFHGAVIECEGPVLLVMELVVGAPLDKYFKRHRSWEAQKHEMARSLVMSGMCCALVYLHSRKPCVVHGDLKPSNIHVEMREAGPFAKLLDFGLARTITRHDLASAGGTKAYMAPELLRSPTGPVGRASPAVDSFAMGVLMQAVVTGRLPGRTQRFWKSSALLASRWDSCMRACMLGAPEARPRMEDIYDELFDAQLGHFIPLGGQSRHGPPSDTKTSL